MKISNSKKELARIISENGGWRDGAESAAQSKSDNAISFYCDTAYRDGDRWCGGHIIGGDIAQILLLPNWHQTTLSREEYLHLHPAPDADGWIEWSGGAANPVEFGVLVDVKLANGDVLNRVSANSGAEWRHCWGDTNIIAYRLHKPEIAPATQEPAPEPVVEAKPTIEQLAADYKQAEMLAEIKQNDADAAKADADARLAKLVAASNAIGLVFSIETTESKCANGVMQITERSQLELGDVIWISKSVIKEDERRLPEGEYKVVKVGAIGVLHNGVIFYPDFSFRSWRFIRRP